jgi:hypothetical protein
MKTLKLFFLFLPILFLVSTSRIIAQTYQYVWHIEISESDNFIGMCLNHQIVGSLDYHVTFHVNHKTGVVDKQHNNILHSDLTDLVTGEKIIVIDTGNDGLNYWGNWYFWDDVTGAGMPITGIWPDNGAAGAMVAGAFKWVSKGGVVATMHWIHQIHINATGEIVVDNYKENMDCN